MQTSAEIRMFANAGIGRHGQLEEQPIEAIKLFAYQQQFRYFR